MDWRSRHISGKNRSWPAKASPNELPNSTHRKRRFKPAWENRSVPTTQGERFCSERSSCIDWKTPETRNSRSALATGCAANCRSFLLVIPTRRFLPIFSVKLTFLRSLLPMAKRQARRSEIRPRLRPDKRLRSRIISQRRWRQRFRLQQVLQVDSLCVPTAMTFDRRAPTLRSISRTVLAASLHPSERLAPPNPPQSRKEAGFRTGEGRGSRRRAHASLGGGTCSGERSRGDPSARVFRHFN